MITRTADIRLPNWSFFGILFYKGRDFAKDSSFNWRNVLIRIIITFFGSHRFSDKLNKGKDENDHKNDYGFQLLVLHLAETVFGPRYQLRTEGQKTS